MKYLLPLVFCLGVNGDSIATGLNPSLGNERTREIVGDIYDQNNEQRVREFGERYGILLTENEEDVTNEENFVRPCSVDDYDCIKQFFKDNSNCVPAYGPISDPLYLTQNTLNFEFANVSLTFTDLQVKGLGKAKIIEFYYNKVTNNVVLAFEVPELIETSPKGYVGYRRKAKESITKVDTVTLTFYNNVFTITIPRIPKLRLDLGEAHNYISNPEPTFYIGPKAYESSDPDVVEGYASLLENLQIVYRDTFIFQSQLFALLYIQENICDFGIKLYSI